MATELDLYAAFKAILAASQTIQGRFFVLATSNGQDLNQGILPDMERDIITDYQGPKKYPCCAMLPPTEQMKQDDSGWATYRCDLFFLTPDQRTGDGDISNPDVFANVSMNRPVDDWAAMRTVANEFKRMFRAKTTGVGLSFAESKVMPDIYRRVTLRGTDRVNGVQLTTEILVWMPVCDWTDYSGPDAVSI